MANLRYCAQKHMILGCQSFLWPNSSQHVANSHCPRRVWQDRFETTTVVALFVPGTIGWPCYHLLSINYFRSPWSSHMIPNSSKRGTDQKDLWVFGFDLCFNDYPNRGGQYVHWSHQQGSWYVDTHTHAHTHVIYIYILSLSAHTVYIYTLYYTIHICIIIV